MREEGVEDARSRTTLRCGKIFVSELVRNMQETVLPREVIENLNAVAFQLGRDEKIVRGVADDLHMNTTTM